LQQDASGEYSIFFDKIEGVVGSTVGYMGGETPNPTYKQISAGGTGYVEVVHVVYNPDIVSYEKLLEVFWEEVGKIKLAALDYHTGQILPVIFCHTEEQKQLAEVDLQQKLSSGKYLYSAKIVEVKKATTFWLEPDEKHQNYCQKYGECN